MAKETGTIDLKAQKAGHDDAAKTATNYITSVTNDGIWVHPDGQGPDTSTTPPTTTSTTGWHMSDVLEYLKAGASWFKLWMNTTLNKMQLRLGLETSGHTVLDDTGMEVFADASTSVARFGSDGAQVGKSTGQHVVIDQDSLDIMNGSTVSATFGETASIGRTRVADSMCINLGKDSGNNRGITEIARWADSSTKRYYLRAIHDINNDNDYVVIGVSNGTYPGYGQYSVALGSHSSRTSGPLGSYSIAEGKDSRAGGEASHAQNLGTIAAKQSQTAIGTYNAEDTSSTTTHPSGDGRYGEYALVIGNGTGDDNRSNAFAVKWDGATVHGTDMSTTVVGDVISPASGITIDSVHCETWGRLASLYISVKPSAAKSGSWDVGTLVPGLRPPFEHGAWTGSESHIAWLYPTGIVRFYGTVAAGASAYVKATYLLA